MPLSATLDHAASSVLGLMARIAAWAALAVGVALAFVFAAAAALAGGLLVLGAAAAMWFTPRRAPAARSETLEARPTARGWVVETETRRRF